MDTHTHPHGGTEVVPFCLKCWDNHWHQRGRHTPCAQPGVPRVHHSLTKKYYVSSISYLPALFMHWGKDENGNVVLPSRNIPHDPHGSCKEEISWDPFVGGVKDHWRWLKEKDLLAEEQHLLAPGAASTVVSCPFLFPGFPVPLSPLHSQDFSHLILPCPPAPSAPTQPATHRGSRCPWSDNQTGLQGNQESGVMASEGKRCFLEDPLAMPTGKEQAGSLCMGSETGSPHVILSAMRTLSTERCFTFVEIRAPGTTSPRILRKGKSSQGLHPEPSGENPAMAQLPQARTYWLTIFSTLWALMESLRQAYTGHRIGKHSHQPQGLWNLPKSTDMCKPTII